MEKRHRTGAAEFFPRLRRRLEQRRKRVRRSIEYLRLKRVRRHSVPAYHCCKNCGTELQGMYCHRCGQYALDVEQPFWKYVQQYFENVYQFDSKVWLTMRLLFTRPGFLTNEFNAGKIASYVHPFRLFMFVSVIFFTVFWGLVSGRVDRIVAGMDLGWPSAVVDRMRSGQMQADTTVWLYRGDRLLEQLATSGIPSPERIIVLTEQDEDDLYLCRARVPSELLGTCLRAKPLSEYRETSELDMVLEVLAGVSPDSLDLDIGDQVREAVRSGEVSAQTLVYGWEKTENSENRLRRDAFISMILGDLSKYTPFFMLFSMPVFALFVRRAFRRDRKPYMAHFVCSLHINTVFLILVSVPLSVFLFDLKYALAEGGMQDSGLLKWTIWLTAAAIFGYMVVAFRNVYRRRWVVSVLRAVQVFLLFSLLALIVAASLVIGLLVARAGMI